MAKRDVPQSTRWKDLYDVAMDESNTTRLPLLLDDAINAVLDQIEDTLTRPRRQFTELNSALADLKLRRIRLAYHRKANSLDNRKAARRGFRLLAE